VRYTYLINSLYFICTCSACPEQYDVFDKDENMVGYVRIIGGRFSVRCPDCLDDSVYESRDFHPLQGRFDDEDQRVKFLNIAACYINEWRSAGNQPFSDRRLGIIMGFRNLGKTQTWFMNSWGETL